MITALSLLLATQLQEAKSVPADRLDLGERLVLLDEQWMRCRDENKKKLAVPAIANAVGAFFSGRFSQGCEGLDRAYAVLNGKPRQGQNYSYQISALLIDSQQEVNVGTKKIYEDPTIPQIEPLDVKQRRLADLNRFVERTHEKLRSQVTKVDSLYVLLDKYSASENNDIREWAKRMRSYTPAGKPESYENVGKEWQALQRAYEDPKPTNFWYGAQGRTKFHVRWPRRFDKNNVTLVVGLHGAGGSPAMFVKSYGAGICVSEANRRGWVFMSPDSTPNAPKDCTEWIEKQGMKVGKLIVMGHSMGGGNALSYTGSRNRKPDALALFAPAPQSPPGDLSRIPTYLAVGEQEMGSLKIAASTLATKAKDWPMFVYEQAPNCEHLMIVAARAREAYKFFDQALRR